MHRKQSTIVGMRRPHDGDGKTFLPKGFHQPFFTSDLRARVGPKGVVQWGGFRDRKQHRRSLIHRGRADENILRRTIAEKLEVNFDVIWRESDPIDNDVEGSGCEDAFDRVTLTDIAAQDLHACRYAAFGLAAIEQAKIHPVFHGKLGARRADYAGAADEEYFHAHLLFEFCTFCKWQFNKKAHLCGTPDWGSMELGIGSQGAHSMGALGCSVKRLRRRRRKSPKVMDQALQFLFLAHTN